jgi:hypothetical protein
MAQEQRFKVGDTVTYKDRNKLLNGALSYVFGGPNLGNTKGVILNYIDYRDSLNCWKILVTCPAHPSHNSSMEMMENEFEEWNQPVAPKSGYIDCETEEQWKFAKEFYKETAHKGIYSTTGDRYLSIVYPGITHSRNSVSLAEIISFSDWAQSVGAFDAWALFQIEATPKVEQFKTGDYIVVLLNTTGKGILHHHVYLQRKDSPTIAPYRDSQGHNINALDSIDFRRKDTWRYATAQEIAAYEAADKPIDVNNLPSSKVTAPPKPPVTEFSKNNYIVVLKACFSHSLNYVYKQRTNCSYIKAYIDDRGKGDNGDTSIMFSDPSTWRYATPAEAALYDTEGGPIDVRKLSITPAKPAPTEFKVGDWVYAEETATANDQRPSVYVPVFQVVDIQHDWIRPKKGSGGIKASLLRHALPHEIPGSTEAPPKPKPPHELLLEEARRRFPIGTMYYPLSAIGDPYDVPEKVSKGPRWVDHQQGIDVGVGYIYLKGKWAQIAQPGEPALTKNEALLAEARRRFPQGMMYMCARTGCSARVVGTDYKWWTAHSICEGSSNGFLYDNGKWAEPYAHATAEGTTKHVTHVPESLSPLKPIDWKNFKIRTPTKAINHAAQLHLFRLGHLWKKGGANVQYTDAKHLCIYSDGYIRFGQNEEDFPKEHGSEVTIEQLRAYADRIQGAKEPDMVSMYDTLFKGSAGISGVEVKTPLRAFQILNWGTSGDSFHAPKDPFGYKEALDKETKPTLHREDNTSKLQLTTPLKKSQKRKVSV